MKKLFCEEKQDFRHDPGNNRGTTALKNFIFLLIIFLLTENISPQIPINGFCRFNDFKVDTGYTKLLMVNFNDDAYSDLLLYNPQKKESALVYGAVQGEFKEIKKISLPFEMNYVQPLNYKSSNRFVFTNRKKRKAGLYELNASGYPVLTRSTDFDSYPEFINTADVDADGNNEILVSGGAFNGISLLYQEDKKLVEKSVISGETFSQAVFIDINNDGYADIAGYDLVSSSFSFFYNNSLGEFRKARSIPFTGKPSSIKTFDINLDSYEDLIFSSGNGINIWYGDFRSSHENTKRLGTNYKPDKYIYGDFNKDGLMDIAYLNVEHSLVSLLFAKNEFDYYPEIIYLMQQGLRDIIPYYSRFIDGIAVLSYEGSIYTITHISSFTDDVNISIGAKPNALSFFDNENNGITDFCFIDEYDKKIKFIIRDITGIPSLYFSQQLFESHEKIIAENIKAGEINYFCFSYNKKIIEVVETDFDNKKINKTVLYSPGAILDIKVRKENDEEYKIFILYKNDDSLNIGVFDYNNLKFNFSSDRLVNNINIFDASLGISHSLSTSYWAEKEEGIFLYNNEPFKINENHKAGFSLLKEEVDKIISFTGDLLNMEKNITISFINKDVSGFAVVSNDTLISVINKNGKPGEFRITSKNNLFFGETRFNGLKKLCAYLPEQNIITRLEFIRHGKDISFSRLADNSDISSYFIKNMTSQNYHVVYTDPKKNCITVKRLKG